MIIAIPYTQLKDFWRRYKRNKMAVVGLIILFFSLGLTILAPAIAPYEPWKMGMLAFAPPGTLHHPLGTDNMGKDIYSGVLYGIRTSLFIGVLAGLSCILIGVLVGAISGYFGGNTDHLLMRLTDFFITIPKVFLAILLVALLGPNIWNVILVVAIVSWPTTARLTRAEFLSLKERDFVMAAKASGAGNSRIIFSEILPNATPPIIINGTIEIASAIALEAGLSFLGLGDPSIPSLGYMLFKAQQFLMEAWWLAVFPGLTIFVIVWAFNLIGDGLNEAWNPRLREG